MDGSGMASVVKSMEVVEVIELLMSVFAYPSSIAGLIEARGVHVGQDDKDQVCIFCGSPSAAYCEI
jgi:hypothetical protein